MWTHLTKHVKFHLKETCLQILYALFSVRMKIGIDVNDAKFTEVRLYVSAKLQAVRTAVSLSDSRPVCKDIFLSNSCLRSTITCLVFTCDAVLLSFNNMNKSNQYQYQHNYLYYTRVRMFSEGKCFDLN